MFLQQTDHMTYELCRVLQLYGAFCLFQLTVSVFVSQTSTNLTVISSINSLENGDQRFPESKITSSNVSFCRQPKDNELTVIKV